MKPKIIKTEQDYEAALAIAESLMDASPGSPEEDTLELWSLLIEQYELKHYPIDAPAPVEAIKFRMDQLGLQQKDLVAYFTTKSKVSEVLNLKRPLSLTMIRELHENLGIPASTLVRKYQLLPPKRSGSSPARGKQTKRKKSTAPTHK